jgi:hypothetical protein
MLGIVSGCINRLLHSVIVPDFTVPDTMHVLGQCYVRSLEEKKDSAFRDVGSRKM